MEFLMTYGWAILVVLAAIGALAYFGVLSPERFLPEKCTLPAGMACLDHAWTGTDFQFVIQNSGGFDMSNISVRIDGTGCNVSATTGPAALADGVQATYSGFTGCAPSAGKFKATLTIDYVNQQTGLSHAKIGEIIAKIR